MDDDLIYDESGFVIGRVIKKNAAPAPKPVARVILFAPRPKPTIA